MHIYPSSGKMLLSFTDGSNNVVASGTWEDAGAFPAPPATGVATGIDAVNVWAGDNSTTANTYRSSYSAGGSGAAPGYAQTRLA